MLVLKTQARVSAPVPLPIPAETLTKQILQKVTVEISAAKSVLRGSNWEKGAGMADRRKLPREEQVNKSSSSPSLQRES